MNPDEYARMDRLEQSMWWYRGLHQLLRDTVQRRGRQTARGLDAGCGTGGLLRVLEQKQASGWTGIEIDSQAARLAKAKTGFAIAAASIESLPFANGAFDVAVSADVLSHAKVRPDLALAELARVMAPGGCLILNLPAYKWLLSRHDRAVQNVRRFTAREVKAELAGHGFAEISTTYWNTLLFPIMALSRLIPRRGDAKSDVMEYPAWLDAIFSRALGIERFMLKLGLRLPFGGSLLVTAYKR
jgi:SAM-dependent methyltransferase